MSIRSPIYLHPENQLLPGIIQQAIAVLIPISCELLIDVSFGWSEVSNFAFGEIAFQVILPLTIFVVAFVFGAALNRTIFKRSSVGRFVWIFPLALLVLAIASDLYYRRSLYEILISYIVELHPGRDVGSVLISLLTYPTISCLAYSLAAWYIHRQRRISETRDPTGFGTA